ncbi:unnamed protein product [Strongylus vulgaris]|uniref:Uncharacterized protein n=1 Tax=Strongylus vulgaris TaxID=40348 RepID=A0A3P7IFY7_STRVU|nr:unnamed protein product [Strongylus vulgaris]
MQKGKEALHTGSISGVGCHQDQCQVAQDAMKFGPEGHVNYSSLRLSHALHLQCQDLRTPIFTLFTKLQAKFEDGREAAE